MFIGRFGLETSKTEDGVEEFGSTPGFVRLCLKITPCSRLLVAEIQIEVDKEVKDSRHSPSRYHYDAPRHTFFNELPFSFDVVILVSINLINVPSSVRGYLVFTFVQV
jgi:hypothetical protein